MAYQLFLDDLRTADMVYRDRPVSDFIIVRSFDAFKSTILERGLPAFISFDNDLGLDASGKLAPDGYAAAKWLVFESGFDLLELKYHVHSANPVAAVQIRSLLDNYQSHLRKVKLEITEQFERIRSKFSQLSTRDAGQTVFGSTSHRYLFHQPVSIQEIESFETRHGIRLPAEYTLFLTEMGNGGAGPYYGLEMLKNVLYTDLDYRKPDELLNPSAPFPHTTGWNAEFKPTVSEEEDLQGYEEQYETFSDMYFDPSWMNGAIAICNYGCGIGIHLVVNGPAHGTIWADLRGSDNGIQPASVSGNTAPPTFFDWYESWLDESLARLPQQTNHPVDNKTPKSPSSP
ncbi:SMI1/KNR4 family protein [Chitinophaga rhizosphaerae]|uniref:SMI1/KNR4 family protein n=1 Tax=Chitinophaga rhizosphaerae TaxID=1864947 RepID=UPI000F800BEA|nr:SMI1/KNR4 family protein [Chitinophaga rhizosphaerae]